METKSRTLELTVLSAEDLRINNRNLKKNAFVVVSIDPFNHRMTKTDAQGGGYPTWNEKFVMDLPARERFIILEVKCRTSSGDRRVGSAKVPVSEFIGGYAPENCLQFLSFRLWDATGQRNGIINFSVRVKGPEREYLPAAQPAEAAGMRKFQTDGTENVGGVVTGIPVWSVTR
ncbi:hypothetical protein SLA2020_510650 [Shorea laevis]